MYPERCQNLRGEFDDTRGVTLFQSGYRNQSIDTAFIKQGSKQERERNDDCHSSFVCFDVNYLAKTAFFLMTSLRVAKTAAIVSSEALFMSCCFDC